MRYEPFERVVLFGGAPLLLRSATAIAERGLVVHVYTAPRHAAEPTGRDGRPLGELLAEAGIEAVVTDDVNAHPELRSLAVDDGTLGLGLGEAWRFDGDLLERFGARLLDFMGIPLPRFRGGAHYTWMILQGEREMACNLQRITPNTEQGVHDDGDIVWSRTYRVSDRARIPQDWFDEAVEHETSFILDFIDAVAAGHDFSPTPVDESRSLHLPRLRTTDHGWIDWSWSGSDVERFVCAFDDPYPGARTTVDGEVVTLKGAWLERDDDGPFHPFQSGLVTRVDDRGTWVATTDGHLRVERVSPAVRPGQRLVTPMSTLEAARTATAAYST